MCVTVAVSGVAPGSSGTMASGSPRCTEPQRAAGITSSTRSGSIWASRSSGRSSTRSPSWARRSTITPSKGAFSVRCASCALATPSSCRATRCWPRACSTRCIATSCSARACSMLIAATAPLSLRLAMRSWRSRASAKLASALRNSASRALRTWAACQLARSISCSSRATTWPLRTLSPRSTRIAATTPVTGEPMSAVRSGPIRQPTEPRWPGRVPVAVRALLPGARSAGTRAVSAACATATAGRVTGAAALRGAAGRSPAAARPAPRAGPSSSTAASGGVVSRRAARERLRSVAM